MKSFSIFSGISAQYIARSEQAKTFYPLNYQDPSDVLKRLDEVEQRTYPTEALSNALITFNSKLGCGQTTLENIEKLRNGAAVVITGQQAGLLTGPAYTVYKAVTAIKLARKWEKEFDRPFVPVFWIASEDHDFLEIRSLAIASEGRKKMIKIQQAYQDGSQVVPHLNKAQYLKKSIGDLKADATAKLAVDELLEMIAEEAPEKTRLEDLLMSTFVEGDSLTDWFGRLLTELFQAFGLIFVDPMMTEIRALESDFFVQTLGQQQAIYEALLEKTTALQDLGLTPSLAIDEFNLNLFMYHQGERLAIKYNGTHWCFPNETDVPMNTDDLIQIMRNSPEKLSTNVVLRPVVQDVLFKTIAYVAGPGELNYYSQLSEVYKVYGMNMPILYPRENFTLISKGLHNTLATYGLSVEEVLIEGTEVIKERLLNDKDAYGIDKHFESFKRNFEKEYSLLLDQMARVSPHLAELKVKNLGLIERQINYMQEKAHRFHRKNHQEIMDLVRTLELELLPDGGLQERTYSILPYFAIGGDALINTLINDLPLEVPHRVIEL